MESCRARIDLGGLGFYIGQISSALNPVKGCRRTGFGRTVQKGLALGTCRQLCRQAGSCSLRATALHNFRDATVWMAPPGIVHSPYTGAQPALQMLLVPPVLAEAPLPTLRAGGPLVGHGGTRLYVRFVGLAFLKISFLAPQRRDRSSFF